MKTKAAIIAAAISAILASGCTDATRSAIAGYGEEYTIEMYSGGQLVRKWVSTGKVLSERQTDGYYFRDKESGALIEVSGDVVITLSDGK
jgi:hypothetical protein